MDPVKQLNIWTNLIILPIAFYAIIDFRHYMILLVYFGNVFAWSSLLHLCDAAGAPFCMVDFDNARAIDHMTAQFGFVLLGAYFIPFMTDFNRNCLIVIAFSVHAFIHALQIGFLIEILLGIECFFTASVLIWVVRYIPFRTFFWAISLGLAGITCYFFDDARIYGFTHALWHVFIFLSFLFMLKCSRYVPQQISTQETIIIQPMMMSKLTA